MDNPDPRSAPIWTPFRTWTAVDIPTNIDIKVTLEALHIWPIVFSRIMQLLGRSYRFVVTRSSAAQKYLPASDVAADAEALWMKIYYPEAKVHFRPITPQDSRYAHAIFQKLLEVYPLDAPYLKFKLLTTGMTNVMKAPTSHRQFQDFLQDCEETRITRKRKGTHNQ